MPRARRRPGSRAHGPRSRSVLLGDEARMAARTARTQTASPSGRSTRGSSGGSPVGACTRPTGRTPRGRFSATSRRSTGTTTSSRSSAWNARSSRRSSGRRRASGRASSSAHTVEVCGVAGDQQASLYGHGCHAAGRGEGDLRHGQLPARAHGRGCLAAAARPAEDGRGRRVRARGRGARERSRGAVAARSSGCSPTRPRARRSPEASPPRRASSSCRRSPGSGRRGGTRSARGLVSGITRGTSRAHLVRAALEGIAHQVADVVEALPERPTVLRADGGASANAFLMQLQADLLGIAVDVAADPEVTAFGAAALAGGWRGGVRGRRALRAGPERATRSPASGRGGARRSRVPGPARLRNGSSKRALRKHGHSSGVNDERGRIPWKRSAASSSGRCSRSGA